MAPSAALNPLYLEHAGTVLRVEGTDDVMTALGRVLAPLIVSERPETLTVRVAQYPDGQFGIAIDGDGEAKVPNFAAVIDRVCDCLSPPNDPARLKISGLLVSWMGRSVILATSDAARLMDLAAFAHQSALGYVGLHPEITAEGPLAVAALPAPVPGSARAVTRLVKHNYLSGVETICFDEAAILLPGPDWQSPNPVPDLAALVLFDWQAESFSLNLIGPDAPGYRIMSASAQVVLPTEPRALRLKSLQDLIPVIHVHLKDISGLDGRLGTLLKAISELGWTTSDVRSVIGLGTPSVPAKAASEVHIPEKSKRVLTTPLTIAMATYDDFDGTYFTIQSTRLFHADMLDRVSFLILDNNPRGKAAKTLKAFENWAPNIRYVPYHERTGTAVRNQIFFETQSEFVMCVDCHVMLAPGALSRLFAYLDANPQTKDLLQGPILHEGHKQVSTHYEPVWKAGFEGIWGVDPRGVDPDAPPFDIKMSGLGLFVARRQDWLEFNPRMRGFGGEEGYIHQKYRNAGRRTLCLPFLRWAHRFARPLGVPYKISWDDRIWNYLLTYRELGFPEEDMRAHFAELLGPETAARLFQRAARDL